MNLSEIPIFSQLAKTIVDFITIIIIIHRKVVDLFKEVENSELTIKFFTITLE